MDETGSGWTASWTERIKLIYKGNDTEPNTDGKPRTCASRCNSLDASTTNRWSKDTLGLDIKTLHRI